MTRVVRRVLDWSPGVDGRVVLLALPAAYLLTVAAGWLVWGVDLWPRLGVPSGPSLFFDARNLTAAWECERLGHDTLYQNPCDPWGRPLNYLRPWLLLGVLGLDQSDTFAVGAAMAGAMFLSFALVAGAIPAGTGVVLALAACSPAVMLAVERANMDVALFSLLSGAVLLWRACPAAARVASPALVLIAAMAKVYPAFALPAFLVAGSRVASRTASICLAAMAVYFAWNARDVAHIARIAPQGVHFAYGARILPAHLYHQVGADRWAGPALVKQLLAAMPLAVAVVIVARWARRFAAREDEARVAGASLVAFHAGTLIYLGTFAIGNNFDYRLVFLLLTLPQLVEWARTPAHPLSRLACVSLAAVVLLLWVGSLSQALALWDEIASWIVAGLLAAAGAATVPRARTIRDTVLGRGTPAGRAMPALR